MVDRAFFTLSLSSQGVGDEFLRSSKNVLLTAVIWLCSLWNCCTCVICSNFCSIRLLEIFTWDALQLFM